MAVKSKKPALELFSFLMEHIRLSGRRMSSALVIYLSTVYSVMSIRGLRARSS